MNATNRLILDDLDEVLKTVSALKEQGMTGLVFEVEDGRYELFWTQSKYYTDQAGVRHIDDVMLNVENQLVTVQDLTQEQLIDLARSAIRMTVGGGVSQLEADLDMTGLNTSGFVCEGNNTVH